MTTTSNAASTYQGFPSANGRIYKFNPTTGTWSNITPSGCPSGALTYGCVSWAALAVDPNNSNKIYASIYGESVRDVFYSNDGGVNWKIVTDDGPAPYPANAHQQAQYNVPIWGYAGSSFKFSWSGGMAVDPFNGNKIYVTTGYAVHVTEDITLPTVTWNTPMKGFEMLVVNVVKVPAKLNGAEVISGVADMAGFRHPDKSSPPPTKFTPASQGIITSIDWMQTNPDVIVKVGGDPGSNGLNSDACVGCGYSVDNGISWTPFTTPTANGWGAYTDGNIAVARTAANNSSLNLVWFPSAKNSGGNANKPVYSINSGSTWTACNFDFGNVTSNSCTEQYWFNSEMVASDKVADNTFYAFVPNWYGSNSNYCQLFRSTDGGQNFTKIYSAQKQWDINGQSIGWNENYLVTLKPNPLVAGDVWIKIGTNLFRCQNALAPVTAIQPDIQRVSQTVITRVQNFGWGAPYPSSTNPTLFIAGTINGIESVFRSTDLGVTWSDILMGEHISLANISSIDGDMNRPGRVFVGTSNRGIFYFEDPTVLPVTITDFWGEITNNQATVSWKVANEVLIKAYIVEKSTDGRTFAPIGQVTATKASAYSFADPTFSDLAYYRLKILEADGSHSYTRIIVLRQNSDNEIITVSPNPFVQDLNISLWANASKTCTVSLFDISGGLHYTATKQLTQGDNSFAIKTDIDKGLYLLKVTYKTGKIQTVKVVKLR